MARVAGITERSRGPHPYVFVATPIALALLGLGGYAISTLHLVLGLACVAGGMWVLMSSAYSAWGRLIVHEDDDAITIMEALGPLKRVVSTFMRSQVRAVVPFSSGPAFMLFPGSAGKQLRVTLDDREIRVGGGLCLDADTMSKLESNLCGR